VLYPFSRARLTPVVNLLCPAITLNVSHHRMDSRTRGGDVAGQCCKGCRRNLDFWSDASLIVGLWRLRPSIFDAANRCVIEPETRYCIHTDVCSYEFRP